MVLSDPVFSAGKVSSRALRSGQGMSSLIIPAGDFTMELWFFPGGGTPSNQRLIQIVDSAGTRFGIDYLNNGFKPQVNGSQSGYGTNDYRDGGHYLAINTGGGSYATLYMDSSRIDFQQSIGPLAGGAATVTLSPTANDYIERVRISSGSRYGPSGNTGFGSGINGPTPAQTVRDASTIVVWDWADNTGAGS